MTHDARERRFESRLALALVLGGFAASVTACGRHASAAECAALLDRYTELLVRQEDPKASEIVIAQQKERTRAKAEKDAAFASCPKEVSAKGAMCAMKAVNVDEFEKCLE
ncbi:MAG: hypothetical protein ABW133_12520 [Polyangiaceae bacterium]